MFESIGMFFCWLMDSFAGLFKSNKPKALPAPVQQIENKELVTVNFDDLVKVCETVSGTYSIPRPEPKPLVIYTAEQVKQQSEAARLEKIKKDLDKVLAEVMHRINNSSLRAERQTNLFAARATSYDPVIVEELMKILTKNGFTLLQNSMTEEWVVRW